VARRWVNEQLVGSPSVRVVIPQDARYGDVLSHGEEVVLNVIEFEDATIPPEILGIFEQVPFVLWDNDWDSLSDRSGVSLGLVAMVMSVQDGIDSTDADLGQQVQNVA
jgi:hypothetical protein